MKTDILCVRLPKQPALEMLALMLLPALVLAAATTAALAGDAASGEAAFGQCKACHSITAPDGTDVVRGGRIGPNLYGVVGRPIASEAAYLDKYGPSIVAAGATGAAWSEGEIATYVTDPSSWLQAITGDGAAKSRMSFRLDAGGSDVAAYLAQFR
jgi:cytochrome c